ncbi:carbon-nitrogen hydrolase family protein [Acidovorax sp. HDW3]|uniref:carbon-nitrogen hydrolase family protein n=1 Tax=Acidovorax sp. HDW3 TaxID=2714923 RepID=UPI0014072AA9|nr:carbon-nitrogen hydrolase family protein [Acidovorax sp. HDW3]QIL42787.1 carbon-nitrogen hydrolase family protein [Acidovorax sp. HDW3]
MKVAAIQMVSGLQPNTNQRQALQLLEQARDAGAELAVLPEYFAEMGADDAARLRTAEPLGCGPVQDFLAETAQRLGLWLVGGTLALQTDCAAQVSNSTLVFDPSGQRVARYDKMHCFAFDNGRERYDEARVVRAGRQPVTLDITARSGRRWRLGLSVCYDLRFPELYRQLSLAGAELLLVPSAFTYTTGQAHWDCLLRARAIENQAYVLAPAQGGQHANGRRTWGHSLLCDPWGEVLAQRVEGAGLVLGTLDAQLLARVRQQLPALEHRVL